MADQLSRRRIILPKVAGAMLAFAGSSLALDGGFDYAEGADEDLVSVESETAQPTSPIDRPLS